MQKQLFFDFSVDRENKTIHVKREFNAELNLVWEAWTNPDLLDQWWAPRPYQTKTQAMDFMEGGRWFYAMISPEGDTHWCLLDYKKIDPLKSYSGLDGFSDEKGQINKDFPRSFWTNAFHQNDQLSVVHISIVYESLGDLEKVIELGFKEGFTMAMGNLDELLQSESKQTSNN